MKTWTPQAEQRFTEYLQERVVREGLDAEDGADLKEDLRRHVYEEAERAKAGQIGLLELETILARMDTGYRPLPPQPVKKQRGWLKRIQRMMLWLSAVILPLAAVMIEWTTSMCGTIFFDPIPSYWHLGMVSLVPIANAWFLFGAPKGNEMLKGLIAGMVAIISGFYAVCFLPLVPLSLIALIFLGMGFLSLSPLLACFASWRIRRSQRTNSDQPNQFRKGWYFGVATILIGLLILEAPGVWTKANLSLIRAGEPNPSAIARLRIFHSEKTLLTSCYRNTGRGAQTDLESWLFDGWRYALLMFNDMIATDAVPLETYHDVFFRVTGKPFNSVKPPDLALKTYSSRTMDQEWEFDPDIGGDNVAIRLKNLNLKESRFDGHLDSVSEIGYGEWTLVFHNTSRNPLEARCQVKLPRDGRVSRVTLWVNDEPREAAFSTVSKVKAAYKQVAVVQQRDPVLVTMAGPDTVMVQCFPVPAGGDMKIRIGITAPFDGNRWELPEMIERNFGILPQVEHAVWLQADRDFQLKGAGKTYSPTADGPGKSLAVTLNEAAITGPDYAVEMMETSAPQELVWCEDPFASGPEQRILIRESKRVMVPGAPKVVLVIDGSVALGASKNWLKPAIGPNVIAILADDHAVELDVKKLDDYRFSGGRDNEPALKKAIQLAKEQGGLPIVWVHGPQAVKLSQTEALLQLLERGLMRPVIYSVQAVPGPNRLAEAIYRTGSLRRGATLRSPEKDFAEFLTTLEQGGQHFDWEWRRASAAEEIDGKQVWDQLARCWAAKAVEDPAMMLPTDQRTATAARYQLVTPFSGAVVLETQAQYVTNGLEPIDPSAAPHVPTVPEPSAALLIFLTLGAGLLRRKR
ncbi:PEP-CTERM sorting domain-containing protein [Luteolibacter pohnpeiensis]|uniref:PEP-CTERM sorting domain-containing protein n=1 Tax=Luteolibacter pohnpeiensis TaxID=454153 RepID=A0A934S6U9_9BACT|nr:VIT domain-containing protein [Luteolibacter pohnpeiensis]MBK1882269.1 PEP-CTERM sorting domain-containing protein [Luteolibacter pohnpeiensis]